MKPGRWCASGTDKATPAPRSTSSGEYLSAKQAEGPAQTTARLLEARIGELLPREVGGRGKPYVAPEGLGHHERHEFRLMAEHRDVWEDKLPLPRTSER